MAAGNIEKVHASSNKDGKQSILNVNIYQGCFKLNSGFIHKSNKFLFATEANILSMLRVHELLGHGQIPIHANNRQNHYEFSKKKIESNIFKETTNDFKSWILYNSEWSTLKNEYGK